jgi:preprotein translocase subunit SecG
VVVLAVAVLLQEPVGQAVALTGGQAQRTVLLEQATLVAVVVVVMEPLVALFLLAVMVAREL